MTIIRLPEVRALTALSTTTLWRLERAGDFPSRIQLANHAVGWYREEVLDWLQKRPRGLGPSPPVVSRA